jgi:PAS domain S-box-containing protein
MNDAAVAEALLSGRADAIIAADRAGIIRFWNPGAERLFSYARHEALEQSLDLIIPERLRQRHWVGYNNVIQTGHSRYTESDLLSVPAIRKDGSTISVEFTVSLIKDPAARSALESTIDMSPWCKGAPIFTSRVPAV